MFFANKIWDGLEVALLFELRNIELTYGDKLIFDKISYPFTDDHKFGLIGRNGTGKSTLCRIISGEEDSDYGEVFRHPSLRLGFLKQDENWLEGETAAEFLERDSNAPDWQCARVAASFAIHHDMLHMPVSKLSGGWRTRLKLAALLLHEPNFLILDEPTNFLDLRTQLLLEKFLKVFKGGALVVSHDRSFLENCCGHTLELSRGKLFSSPCRVSVHLAKRAERIEHEKRSNAASKSKMKQLQKFIDKNRAGANTAAQARNKQKQLDRIELYDVETAEAMARIRLPKVERQRKTVFECEDLAIGYGENRVAGKINFTLEPGEKLSLCGDNGQGKTTLLKTITEDLSLLGGQMRWGFGCTPGVYAQHVYSSLPRDLTIREYLLRKCPAGETEKRVLDIAGGFLFTGKEVDKKIGVLSGGERARLTLAGLFLTGDNVLVLDEPSNHLDVETSSALAKALNAYEGAVIFVSHERSFCSEVATGVLEINGGRVRRVPGGYAGYLHSLEEEADSIEDAGKPQKAEKASTSAGGNEAVSGRERFDLEKRLQSIERQIEKKDSEIEQIDKKLHELADDWQEAAKLGKAIESLRSEKDRLEDEWLEIHELLEV